MKKILLLIVCVFINMNIKGAELECKIESESVNVRKAQLLYWFNAYAVKLNNLYKERLLKIIKNCISNNDTIDENDLFNASVNEAIHELNKNKNINTTDLEYLRSLLEENLSQNKCAKLMSSLRRLS